MVRTALMFALVVWALASDAAPGKASSAISAPVPSLSIFENSETPRPEGRIDQLVFAKLASMGIRPVICSDAVFVRRAFLDVIGTVPTAQEARDFIRDPDTQNKRRKLIDQLLGREEFADYWAMRWGDILRIKAEFPVNLWPNAAQAYHHWVRASLAANKPYDQFARELLTSSGSNFRVGPVNFYRAIQNRTPEGIAGAVALAFMGSRVDAWPKAKVQGLAAFFSQVGYKPSREWKEELVYWDPLGPLVAVTNAAPGKTTGKTDVVVTWQPTNAIPREGVFPDGVRVKLPMDRDPRDIFAAWLIDDRNPWFARCAVNRIWAWLMGRGIIHEPDDIRPDNPPVQPELLAYLERELIAGRYDTKRIYRLILNSHTYQMSSMPRYDKPQAQANFASYPLRRLDAEVLIDAINKISGTTDLYTSAIPEPFTYIPQDKPAVTLPDGSIISPFLALFGRSARATGLDSERVNRQGPAQWMHLLNSSHIQKKIEQGPRFKVLCDPVNKPDAVLENLYLTILSRFPTQEEIQQAKAYAGGVANLTGKDAWMKRREIWVDIIWALINSSEFLYRH